MYSAVGFCRKGKIKIKYATHKFHSFQSPGLEKVFPVQLKEGMDLIMSKLISIFYHQGLVKSESGVNPEAWQNFSLKSLTSFLLKMVKRLLGFSIRKEVLKRFLLHTKQHAHQMGKSTDTALHLLTQKVEKVLKNEEVALGCFRDIDGAFESKVSITKSSKLLRMRQWTDKCKKHIGKMDNENAK